MKIAFPTLGLVLLVINCGSENQADTQNTHELTKTSAKKLGLWFDEGQIPAEIATELSTRL